MFMHRSSKLADFYSAAIAFMETSRTVFARFTQLVRRLSNDNKSYFFAYSAIFLDQRNLDAPNVFF
jgi:hypothetical protein